MRFTKIKLLRTIFDYYIHWLSLPNDTVDYANDCCNEGIAYCDGYHASFWYLLNLEWCRMNNKMYASFINDCTDYFNPDNHFIESYWDDDGD